MAGISVVSSTLSTSFFCIPEPGKPDPNESWDLAIMEQRKRVVYSGQKANTCWYYGLQLLRNNHRIGKKPTESQLKQRSIEIIVSKFRKNITQVDKALGVWTEIAECLIDNGYNTKEKTQEFLGSKIGELSPITYQEDCRKMLKSFCEQEACDDLFIYAVEPYTHALRNAYRGFFEELGVFEGEIALLAENATNKSWDQFSLTQKCAFEKAVAVALAARSYGCKRSLWHPEKPIETLIEQLQLHGPHLVMGRFFECSWVPLAQTIEERPVFSWEITQMAATAHALLIVGTEVTGQKNLVYLLDPRDSSDPKKKSTQKIYVMPYEMLISSIMDLSSAQNMTSNGKPIFREVDEKENHYAFYMPK